MNLNSNFSDFEAEEKFVSAIISAPDELIELQPDATYFELNVCSNFVQTALDFVRDGVNYALDTTIFYDILGINEVIRFSSDTVPSFHAKYYLERVKEAYRKR